MRNKTFVRQPFGWTVLIENIFFSLSRGGDNSLETSNVYFQYCLFPVLLFISTTFALNFQVLEGNSNVHEVKKNIIPVIYARYFLLIPLKWYHWTCTRMEVYGEPWPEGISLYLIYKFQWRSIIPRARVCLFFFFLLQLSFVKLYLFDHSRDMWKYPSAVPLRINWVRRPNPSDCPRIKRSLWPSGLLRVMLHEPCTFAWCFHGP